MGPIDLGSPINWSHPLNEGRVFWGYVPKNYPNTGNTLVDLVGLSLRNPGNNGTLTNGPTWVPTPRGDNGLSFDGTNDYVAFPHADVLNVLPFSYAAWIWLAPASSGARTIFGWTIVGGSGTPPAFRVNAAGNLEWTSQTSLVLGTGATVLPTSQWLRVGMAFNPTTNGWSLYLNGAVDSTGSSSPSSITFGTASRNMGSASATQFFNGYIADPSVYNRVLSPSEFAADYDLSQRGYPGVLNRVHSKYWLLGASSPAPSARQQSLMLMGLGA